MTHFFITVGTSQLENKVFRTSIGDRKLTDALDAIINERSRAEAKDSAYINQRLQDWLASKWDYVNTGPGLWDPKDGNPFGAEITTLWHLLHRPGMSFTVPGEDFFFLLTSSTMPGRLAGRVACDFLTHAWQVPNQRLWLYEIPKLTDDPGTADDAKYVLFEFARMLSTALTDSVNLAGEHRPARQFVMSGGFKSLIPVLDWFSLAYQIPLNYLFEKSEHPIRGLTLELEKSARESIRNLIQKKYPGFSLPPIDRF